LVSFGDPQTGFNDGEFIHLIMTITSNIPKINVEAKPLACKAGIIRNAPRVRKTPLTFQAWMSGSPVLLGDGSAIGVVCVSGGVDPRLYTEGGPNPRLMTNLPGWCLRALAS
jgi:hypothetical protein